jgi:pyridoxamine 5'-phosphate oxidase
MAIHQLRQEYNQPAVDLQSMKADPFEQFTEWFYAAKAAMVVEPNAFTLATASADGEPDARTLLLKSVDSKDAGADRGFVFFTNYTSDKAKQLSENPRAAMNFFWGRAQRCVRVVGNVSKIDAQETATYFASRPRASQLGAWCSDQSAVIPSRDVLDEKFEELKAKYGDDQPIPVPADWGGYRVVPRRIEFWQGQPSRLHDRMRYVRDDQAESGWSLQRLSP